jgi:Glycosyl transferase family 2
MGGGGLYSFAICVEWENTRFAELQRTRLMLRSLRAQIMALPQPPVPPVINFLFDRRTVDAGLMARVLAEEFTYGAPPVEVNTVATDGLRYYELKNLGAQRASAEIQIFLDCDVVPEPGWLAAMLDAFDDPKVGVVGGETYIEEVSFYSRAFALFWFFPLRDGAESLELAPRFHANNVAFRSAVFAKHPFPDMDSYRGQCVVLGRTLHANHVGLYVQKRARVSHPRPLGLWYFVARALHNGRDWVLTLDVTGQQADPVVKRIRWTMNSNIRRASDRIRRYHRQIGLGAMGKLAAFGLAGSYFVLQALGSWITLYWRDAIRRYFPI